MPLLLLLLLFALVRGAILFLAFDDVCVPGYELWPGGVVALEILQGLPSLPLLAFHDSHSGGQMLSALLGAGVFAVAGTSYLALKLVPLLFAAGTLVVTYLTVQRRLGRDAAILAGLLLVFAPAAFVDFSTANYGNHGEVVFFVALSVEPFLRVVADGRRGAGTLFWFGLTCGLAVWYALSALLVLGLYVAFWLARDRRVLATRSFLVFLAGLALGLLPLFVVLWARGAPQADWLAARFVERSQASGQSVAGRFASFWTDILPRAACSYDVGPVSGDLVDAGYVLLWALCAFVVARRCRGTALLALAYPLALAGAYAVSDFVMGTWEQYAWGGFRYLMTFFWVMTLLVVLAWRMLSPAGARLLAVAAVGLGVLGNAGHSFELDHFGDGARMPGHNDFKLARAVYMQPVRDLEALEGLPPARRAEVYRGIGAIAALQELRRDGKRSTQDFDPGRIVDSSPERYRVFVARGIGTQLAEHAQIEGQAEAAEWGREALLRLRHPLAGAIVQGLFLPSEPSLPELDAAKLDAALDGLATLPTELVPCALEGLGMHVGRALWRGVPRDVTLARVLMHDVLPARCDAAQRARFHRGLGYACWGYGDDPGGWDETVRAQVRVEDQPAVFEGIAWMSAEVFGR